MVVVVTAQQHVAATVWAGPLPEPMRHLDARTEVAVRLRPAAASIAHTEHNVAHSVLLGLGHLDETGQKLTLRHVSAHLQAHRIAHLVVVGAHHAPQSVLDKLNATAAAAHARLWCVFGRTEQVPATDMWEPQPADEFFAMFARRQRGTDLCDAPWCAPEPEREAVAFPPVPADDCATFLLACHDLLEPAHAEVVRARVLHAEAAARRHLHKLDLTTVNRGGTLRPHQLAVHLARQIVQSARSIDEAVAGLRGLQLAFTHKQIVMSVDLNRLVPQLEATAHQRPGATDPERWRLLTRYRGTSVAATVTLSAAGLTLAEMLDLPVEHVAEGGGHITLGWRRFDVPPAGRVLLRTQLNTARLHHSPSLLTGPDGHPAHLGHLRQWLARPAHDLGVDLIGRPRSWSGQEEGRWLRDHGIRLQWGRAITGVRDSIRIDHGHGAA